MVLLYHILPLLAKKKMMITVAVSLAAGLFVGIWLGSLGKKELREEVAALSTQVSEKNKEVQNKNQISDMRTAIKKANVAIEAKSEDMAVAVNEAVKKIDQAADKGIIHKNNAARKKSALVTRFNKVNA